MRLSEVKKDVWVRIDEVLQSELRDVEDNAFLIRMLELGLRPGASVCLRHIAPLGDPISIEVNGSLVGISRKQCHIFTVTEVKS